MEGNDIFCENKRPHTTKATKTKEKLFKKILKILIFFKIKSFAKTKWDSQVSKPSVNNERRDTDGNYAFAKKQEEFQKSNIFGQVLK